MIEIVAMLAGVAVSGLFALLARGDAKAARQAVTETTTQFLRSETYVMANSVVSLTIEADWLANRFLMTAERVFAIADPVPDINQVSQKLRRIREDVKNDKGAIGSLQKETRDFLKETIKDEKLDEHLKEFRAQKETIERIVRKYRDQITDPERFA